MTLLESPGGGSAMTTRGDLEIVVLEQPRCRAGERSAVPRGTARGTDTLSRRSVPSGTLLPGWPRRDPARAPTSDPASLAPHFATAPGDPLAPDLPGRIRRGAVSPGFPHAEGNPSGTARPAARHRSELRRRARQRGRGRAAQRRAPASGSCHQRAALTRSASHQRTGSRRRTRQSPPARRTIGRLPAGRKSAGRPGGPPPPPAYRRRPRAPPRGGTASSAAGRRLAELIP